MACDGDIRIRPQVWRIGTRSGRINFTTDEVSLPSLNPPNDYRMRESRCFPVLNMWKYLRIGDIIRISTTLDLVLLSRRSDSTLDSIGYSIESFEFDELECEVEFVSEEYIELKPLEVFNLVIRLTPNTPYFITIVNRLRKSKFKLSENKEIIIHNTACNDFRAKKSFKKRRRSKCSIPKRKSKLWIQAREMKFIQV